MRTSRLLPAPFGPISTSVPVSVDLDVDAVENAPAAPLEGEPPSLDRQDLAAASVAHVGVELMVSLRHRPSASRLPADPAPPR